GFFESNFGKIHGACTKAKMEINGRPSALYFIWDAENQQTELMAAVPINGESSLKQFEAFKVAGPAIMIAHYGSYESTGKAHEAMEAYLNWHGIEMSGPAIEEYVTDPTTVSDTSEI